MFQGAHFCMACGTAMDRTSGHGSTPGVGATPHGLPTRQLDEDWDAPDAQRSLDARVVPEDELEIEEVVDTGPTSDDRAKGQVISALRQVRDYLIELDLESAPSGDCLDVCREVLGSLNGSVFALGDDLADAYARLSGALGQRTPRHPVVDFEELARVKEKYVRVAELLPELGDFEAERRRRVRLIVRAILEDVPGLGPLGRSKLEQAGLGEVETLCAAGRSELAAAGLDEELAGRVFERIARFRRRLNSVPPDAGRSSERARLKLLTLTLGEQNERFAALADDWTRGSAEARRELRDARAETMSQVSLLLARLGELGMAERIERLPFDKKASELERLLGALDDTHGPSQKQSLEKQHA
jgi:hypothetical protein